METVLDWSVASMCVCSCLGWVVAGSCALTEKMKISSPERSLHVRTFFIFFILFFLLLIKNITSKCKELDGMENFILGVSQLLLNFHGNEIA